MKLIKRKLKELIETAKVLGLDKKDIDYSSEFLEYNEYELCFDQMVTQLYEYGIEVTLPAYQLIEEIGGQLNLHSDSYSFIKELIKSEN